MKTILDHFAASYSSKKGYSPYLLGELMSVLDDHYSSFLCAKVVHKRKGQQWSRIPGMFKEIYGEVRGLREVENIHIRLLIQERRG